MNKQAFWEGYSQVSLQRGVDPSELAKLAQWGDAIWDTLGETGTDLWNYVRGTPPQHPYRVSDAEHKKMWAGSQNEAPLQFMPPQEPQAPQVPAPPRTAGPRLSGGPGGPRRWS